MDDQEFEQQVPASAPSVGFDQSANKPDGARARLPTVAALLGLLAGDDDSPREGQRDIIASAIRHALDTSSTSEFPNLARLIDAAGIGELDQRAARCRSRHMHVRGQYQDVPVLALSAEIHRNDFIDADGKEARCKLFLALVDLALSCPELLGSNPFRSAVAGLRILLERLAAQPKGSVATRHFSVWQLFDWVEQNASGALFWNCRQGHGADWEQPFRAKLEEDLGSKELMFLLGNQHRFQDQWLIVSLIYPPKRKPDDDLQMTLL